MTLGWERIPPITPSASQCASRRLYTTQKTPSRKNVIEELIDEKLKLQLLKRFSIEGMDNDVENAFAGMARRARMTPRRLTHVPAERGAERARRAVADPRGDLGEPELAAAQQLLGHRHAPGEQVLHRRPSDDAREALEERRA